MNYLCSDFQPRQKNNVMSDPLEHENIDYQAEGQTLDFQNRLLLLSVCSCRSSSIIATSSSISASSLLHQCNVN